MMGEKDMLYKDKMKRSGLNIKEHNFMLGEYVRLKPKKSEWCHDLRTRTSFLHSYHCQWLFYHWRRTDRWNNNMQRLETPQISQCNHAWEQGNSWGENVIDRPENKIEEGLTNRMGESEPQWQVNDPAPEEPSGQDDWHATEGSRAVK